jgi:hypothetical protein
MQDILEAHPREGCELLAPPQAPPNRNLKNADFVDISKHFRDLPLSRNQLLKSSDDQYMRILNNKLK